MSGKIYKLELEVPYVALGAILSINLKTPNDEAWMRVPMTMEIPESKMGVIISGLVEAKIKLSGVTDTGRMDTTPNKTREGGYVGGKRDKGISGRDLIMETLESEKRAWKGDEISRAFVKREFAGGSWAPPMSELVREGKVRTLGRGYYCLPGYTLRPGETLS